MKNRHGFQVIGIVIAIAIIALVGIGAFFVIDGNNKATDYNNYDFDQIIQADAHTGNIADHIKGDPNAPVLIFEYADYQCPGCASVNPKVNKAIEELDGKLAIVYRNFLLSYHKNGTAAGSAAEAAGLQGYWKPYADKLFASQAEWESSTGSERTAIFEKYFNDVSKGKGDLEKFRQDIAGEDVSQKISFDMGIARRIDIPSTPAFYVDGQYIKWSEPGELTINGKTIAWEESRSGDQFIELLKEIVEAKTNENSK
jgi:predicted DsbA family dithiol-disulfide isomerase